jgi:hypothetical protein
MTLGQVFRRTVCRATDFEQPRSDKRNPTKWLLLFVLVIAFPTFAQRVQNGSKSCAWTTSCTASFATNVTTGDSVAVAVSVSAWGTGPQTPAVSDSQGNQYVAVSSVSNPSSQQVFLFCAPIATAGADSITSTIGRANNQAMVTLEFQGSCAVDGSTAAIGNSSSATTQSIPAHSGDFLVGVATSQYADTFHPAAGFVADSSLGNIAMADSLQGTADSAAVTFTLGNSTNWTAQLVAFITTTPSAYSITATLTWDDGTPIAGTVAIAQQISTNPLTANSLGSFRLDANGTATGNLTPNLALPLTFVVTLINPAGTVVNSMTLFANNQILQGAPHVFHPLIVLTKSSATVKSVSF